MADRTGTAVDFVGIRLAPITVSYTTDLGIFEPCIVLRPIKSSSTCVEHANDSKITMTFSLSVMDCLIACLLTRWQGANPAVQPAPCLLVLVLRTVRRGVRSSCAFFEVRAWMVGFLAPPLTTGVEPHNAFCSHTLRVPPSLNRWNGS